MVETIKGKMMPSSLGKYFQRRILSLVQISLLGLVLAGAATGCAGRREPGYADKDGATAVTRDKDAPANYGSSSSGLDRQADDNKVDLMKYKKSF